MYKCLCSSMLTRSAQKTRCVVLRSSRRPSLPGQRSSADYGAFLWQRGTEIKEVECGSNISVLGMAGVVARVFDGDKGVSVKLELVVPLSTLAENEVILEGKVEAASEEDDPPRAQQRGKRKARSRAASKRRKKKRIVLSDTDDEECAGLGDEVLRNDERAAKEAGGGAKQETGNEGLYLTEHVRFELDEEPAIWTEDGNSIIVADLDTNVGARAKIGSTVWLCTSDEQTHKPRLDRAILRAIDAQAQTLAVEWIYSGEDLRKEEFVEGSVPGDEFVTSNHFDEIPFHALHGVAADFASKWHYDLDDRCIRKVERSSMSPVEEAIEWARVKKPSDEVKTRFGRRTLDQLALFTRFGSERWQLRNTVLDFLPSEERGLTPPAELWLRSRAGAAVKGPCAACGLPRTLSMDLIKQEKSRAAEDCTYNIGPDCARKIGALLECTTTLRNLRTAILEGQASEVDIELLLTRLNSHVTFGADKLSRQRAASQN